MCLLSLACMRLLAPLSLLLLACAPLPAQIVEAHHARMELLAERDAVASHQRLWLGVHFQLEKGWHIYWINSGDSGQPPALRWQLPFGFHAGEIHWPRPEKLKTSQLADYGYEDEVVLLVPVQTPYDLKHNFVVNIDLDAKWLICRELCIPDRAHLHLALPYSTIPPPDTAHAKLFANARKLLPKVWPSHWQAMATSGKDDFVLTVQADGPFHEAEFFPLEPNQIENAAPQPVRATARGAKITLKKSDLLVKPISELKGLLVLRGGDAYQIVAPVTQQ
jgi:DsbC/DsbD-like thiol-disulfide interchange protein